jgi:hypothetical protein
MRLGAPSGVNVEPAASTQERHKHLNVLDAKWEVGFMRSPESFAIASVTKQASFQVASTDLRRRFTATCASTDVASFIGHHVECAHVASSVGEGAAGIDLGLKFVS